MLTDETVADLVHAVAGTDRVRIIIGDAERANRQVAIIFAVGVTSGNIPSWTFCIHTETTDSSGE